ncbi:MAG: heat-inducible transcriptional repressor HrcA [Eubacteriales bacterium]|nr:heat-inducible transcriptional repressor HrcA [Eubacteriales bacterium]
MELNERKSNILGAIIESYISTAEPVGSRTIAKNELFNLSPATIRNEMADLEEMGFLEQPHTSAGRVPSEKGYRYYVDRLMNRYKLNMDEIALLRTLLESKISEVGVLAREISSICSKMTNCTIVAITPETEETTIRQIQMMVVDRYTVLLVIITSASTVKTKQIAVSHPVERGFLNTLSGLLNQIIANRRVDEINIDELMAVKNTIPDYHELLQQMLIFVYECLDEVSDSDVFLGGVSNILSYPEYSNIARAKELLDFLEDEHNIKRMFKPLSTNKDIQVFIGSENLVNEMRDCSVVLSHYHIHDHQFGAIGIIGPKRMDYAKAVSMLEYFTKQLASGLDDK